MDGSATENVHLPHLFSCGARVRRSSRENCRAAARLILGCANPTFLSAKASRSRTSYLGVRGRDALIGKTVAFPHVGAWGARTRRSSRPKRRKRAPPPGMCGNTTISPRKTSGSRTTWGGYLRLSLSQSGTILVPSGSASADPRRGTPYSFRMALNVPSSSVSPNLNLIIATS